MMTGLKLILIFNFYFQASKSLKDLQIVICLLGSVFCSGVLVGMRAQSLKRKCSHGITWLVAVMCNKILNSQQDRFDLYICKMEKIKKLGFRSLVLKKDIMDLTLSYFVPALQAGGERLQAGKQKYVWSLDSYPGVLQGPQQLLLWARASAGPA